MISFSNCSLRPAIMSNIGSIVFVMCLVICAHAIPPPAPRIPDVDTGILNLVDTIIGEYDNRNQISVGCNQHTHIQARLIPIRLDFPAFLEKVLLLFELAVDGQVVLLQIMVVEIDVNIKNVYSLVPHNFTDPSKYRPGQYQVQDLQNEDFSNIDTDPQCVIRFLLLDDGSYSAVWPDCRSIVDGKHPAYIVTLTCTYYTAAVPLFTRERATSSVYFYKKQRINVPIPFAPPDFESICRKLKRLCPILKIE